MGADVAHVDALEVEVAPARHGEVEAAVAVVDHDLAGVVAEHEAVAVEEQVGDLLDAARVVEVEGPHAPVRRLEEGQAGLGGGEVELVAADQRRAVGVDHHVRVAQPGLAEIAGLEPGDVHGGVGTGGPEAVAVLAQHRRVAQVHEVGDAVLDDRPPARRVAQERRHVVLVDHEGEARRAGEVGRGGGGAGPLAARDDVDADGAVRGVRASVEGGDDVVARVAHEPGHHRGLAAAALGRRPDAHDHRGVGCHRPGVGAEQRGCRCGGSQPQRLPDPAGAGRLALGLERLGGGVAVGGSAVEALAHLHEAPRQEVEGTELLLDREAQVERRERRADRCGGALGRLGHACKEPGAGRGADRGGERAAQEGRAAERGGELA